jgi:hypothetical protein
MLFAYFGGLGADKQTIAELLLEQRGQQYAVTMIMRPERLAEPSAGRRPWRWFRKAASSERTRKLYQGPDARLGLRILFAAACTANMADYGQRFCYVLPSVPAQPGALAPLIPEQLRTDGSLPIHPQLWQIGRPLDTLPTERHRQASTDEHSRAKLTSGGRSLDEGYLR